MIKEQVKCPRCGKVLLRAHSTAVTSVRCKCGYTVDLKHPEKEGDKKRGRGLSYSQTQSKVCGDDGCFRERQGVSCGHLQ